MYLMVADHGAPGEGEDLCETFGHSHRRRLAGHLQSLRPGQERGTISRVSDLFCCCLHDILKSELGGSLSLSRILERSKWLGSDRVVGGGLLSPCPLLLQFYGKHLIFLVQ